MRKRKIGSRTLTAREPQNVSISLVNLNIFNHNIRAFVKDYMQGAMTLNIEAPTFGSDLGFMNICSYFFSYALRLIVEYSSLTEPTNVDISNTEREVKIRITHHSVIPDEIIEKIRAAVTSANFAIEVGEGEITLTTAFIPTPDLLSIYAHTPDTVYFDLVSIFFWGEDVENPDLRRSWE